MPCNCLTKINKELEPHHFMISYGCAIWGGDCPVELVTEKLSTAPKRFKKPAFFASFCPFCGTEYVPPKTLEAFNEEHRQRQAGTASE